MERFQIRMEERSLVWWPNYRKVSGQITMKFFNCQINVCFAFYFRRSSHNVGFSLKTRDNARRNKSIFRQITFFRICVCRWEDRLSASSSKFVVTLHYEFFFTVLAAAFRALTLNQIDSRFSFVGYGLFGFPLVTFPSLDASNSQPTFTF